MPGHRFHVLVATALAAGALFASGPSAEATTTGTGTFAGTAVLSSGFPCSTCTGGGLSGTAGMSLSGAPQNGLNYTATWPDPRTTPPGVVPTNFNASFGYTNLCDVTAPVLPLRGAGGGPFTLSGGLLVLNGAVWDNATLTGTLTWQWAGTGAYATLTGLTITGGSGSTQVAATVNLAGVVVGQGVMTFAWTNGPGNCAVQNPYQTANVLATFVQPT